MSQEDFFFINNKIQTEKNSIHDAPLIDTMSKVFTLCFQKLGSFCSQKTINDIYFRKGSSIFTENSHPVYGFEKKNSYNIMDNFDKAFKQFQMDKNSEQHDYLLNKGEEDLISEDDENSPHFFQDDNMAEFGCPLDVYVDDTILIPTTRDISKKKKSKRGCVIRKPIKITYDKYFPFSAKKGINNPLFRTDVYLTNEEGNRKREKKARKFKPDDIRKKIKVRFHKKIKNIINENLKKAGSNELISFLPQFFLGNISKKFNKQYFNTTFEELLKIDFSTFQEKYPNKECDKKQFNKNMKTLEYLEKNPEISKISGFNIVKKMKYRDILKAYFSSHEFELSVELLKLEKESEEYIQEYIYLAKNYIEYFTKGDECV